ncbi:diacylglycerol kinase family protein [Niveispirillum sp. KHB5.9]|uniref:diacylglycerol kinase family protein n=1 Tax=Niveispirillum sp. KHB5.9 TaxID=3400269 RepID=UPI003A8B3B6D
MARPGLIRNPFSHRNHGGRAVPADAARLFGPHVASPDTPEKLIAALAGFVAGGVDVLVVDGGDGTVREVLTALPHAYGDNPPKIAILAGGKTNLIAADVGTTGYGARGMAGLVRAAHEETLGRRTTRRPVLSLHWPDGEHTDVRGMFMGAGAFTRGTDLANAAIHKAGFTQEIAVALTMAGVLGRALIGNDQHGWLAGEDFGAAVDGDAVGDGNRFLFLATTLNRLIMGLWPFWNHGDRPLRYLDVAANPPGLLGSLPRLMTGRPSAAMRDGDAYRSGGAERIELRLTRPLIMDGETYPAGRVILSAHDSISFVQP